MIFGPVPFIQIFQPSTGKLFTPGGTVLCICLFKVVAVENHTLHAGFRFEGIFTPASRTLVLLPEQTGHTQGAVHPAGRDKVTFDDSFYFHGIQHNTYYLICRLFSVISKS